MSRDLGHRKHIDAGLGKDQADFIVCSGYLTLDAVAEVFSHIL